MRLRRRCSLARVVPSTLFVLALALLATHAFAAPIPASPSPGPAATRPAGPALAANATALSLQQAAALSVPMSQLYTADADVLLKQPSTTSTHWVTKTRPLSATPSRLTPSQANWIPRKRTPWYQRKALFITSFFLAIVIILIIGAVVVVYDRDRSLTIAAYETEDEAAQRILMSRINREQEKAQHREDNRRHRRDRWKHLQSTTRAMVTRPMETARSRRRCSCSRHSSQHHLHTLPPERQSTPTSLRDSVEGHCVSPSVSARQRRAPRPADPDVAADVSDSNGRHCSTCDFDLSPTAHSGSDADRPRPASRTSLAAPPSIHPVPFPGTVGGCDHDPPSLSQEDRDLAQRYIAKQIALLKRQITEWRQLQQEAGEMTPGPEGPADDGVSSASPPRGSAALLHSSRDMQILLHRAGETQPSLAEPAEEQDQFLPAYIPSQPGAAPESARSGAAGVPARQLDQKPAVVPSEPAAAITGAAISAHIATDDKHFLASLRAEASNPPHPAEASTPSAPALPNAEGFELRSSRGKDKAVQQDAMTSTPLPPPPMRLEPAYAFDAPSMIRGALPITDPEKMRLAVLMSGPSAPAPPAHETPVPSAPALDTEAATSLLPSAPAEDEVSLAHTPTNPPLAEASHRSPGTFHILAHDESIQGTPSTSLS